MASADTSDPSGVRLANLVQSDQHLLLQSGPLLDLLPVGVWICDRAGTVVGHNRRAIDLWGHAPRPGEQADDLLAAPSGAVVVGDRGLSIARLASGESAAGSSARGVEVLLQRDDGSRVAARITARSLANTAGAALGTVVCFEDVTETRRLQTELLVNITERKWDAETSQYLASIVDSSNDAIISKDLNGIITSWNQAAERMFGYTAAEAIGKSITILIPSDRLDEEAEILRRIRRGDRVGHYDTVRQCKDGSPIEVSLAVSPVRSIDGMIVGASKIARDIRDRKRAADKQALLLREISHRTKNLFALAGSVVTLSARFVQTPEEMARAVRARLHALSQAHDLTLPDFVDGLEQVEKRTTLRALIRTIVLPFGETIEDADEEHDRITTHGPEVWIGGSAMTSVALLLHEFATNAAKYGALSGSTGRVDVVWLISGDDLHLTWQERGGPTIGDHAHVEGFGSLLARSAVQAQLAGSIARDWAPEGLTVRLVVSLDRLGA